MHTNIILYYYISLICTNSSRLRAHIIHMFRAPFNYHSVYVRSEREENNANATWYVLWYATLLYSYYTLFVLHIYGKKYRSRWADSWRHQTRRESSVASGKSEWADLDFSYIKLFLYVEIRATSIQHATWTWTTWRKIRFWTRSERRKPYILWRKLEKAT